MRVHISASPSQRGENWSIPKRSGVDIGELERRLPEVGGKVLSISFEDLSNRDGVFRGFDDESKKGGVCSSSYEKRRLLADLDINADLFGL